MRTYTVALAAAVTIAGSTPAGASPSGLPWLSGAKGDLRCLAQLRHRPIDLVHVEVGGQSSFAVQVANVDAVLDSSPRVPNVLIGLALLTIDTKGQFAECAAGNFDRYWKKIGARLAADGRRFFIEPGWEANLSSTTHPWGVDRPDQLPAYKACFSHVGSLLKEAVPRSRILWTNAKRYDRGFRVEDMDPGTEDAYGLMYYDNIDPKGTAAIQDAYSITHNVQGGPQGIQTWLDYADQHGHKKLGLTEWGLWQQSVQPPAYADDPSYITWMGEFFRKHSSGMLYDSYQNNSPNEHELCPTNNFPKSTAAYASEWTKK